MAGFSKELMKDIRRDLGEGELVAEAFDDLHKYADRIRILNWASIPYTTFYVPKGNKEGIIYNNTVAIEKGIFRLFIKTNMAED